LISNGAQVKIGVLGALVERIEQLKKILQGRGRGVLYDPGMTD